MVSSTRSLTNLLPHNLGHENTDGTERSNATTSIGMSYSRPPLSNPNQDSYMLDCGSPYVISQCHGVQQCSSFCDDKSIDQYRYSCSVRKVPSQRPMSMRNARKYSKMRQRVKQDHKYSNKIGIFSCNNYVWKSGLSREATDVKDGDVVASTYSSDMCDADISNMSADDDYENDSESRFSSKSDCSVVGSSPCLNDVSSCNSRTNDSGGYEFVTQFLSIFPDRIITSLYKYSCRKKWLGQLPRSVPADRCMWAELCNGQFAERVCRIPTGRLYRERCCRKRPTDDDHKPRCRNRWNGEESEILPILQMSQRILPLSEPLSKPERILQPAGASAPASERPLPLPQRLLQLVVFAERFPLTSSSQNLNQVQNKHSQQRVVDQTTELARVVHDGALRPVHPEPVRTPPLAGPCVRRRM